MTKTKSTKRALLSSVLALVMCASMLIGSTFAWFTDSVTNGKNKIVSGNLDVELWHSTYADSADNSQWGLGFGYSEAAGTQVDADTDLFVNVDGNSILWEPGAVAVENFRIKNVGSLALKFMFKLEIANATQTPEGKDLTDILDLYIDEINWDDNGVPTGTTIVVQKLGDGYVIEGELLAGEDYDFWVGLEWEPSDVDNEYNVTGGLSLDLGVTLLATQYTYEKDGYNDDQYDADAEYPVVALPPITSADDLQEALNNGGEFVLGADIAMDSELVVPAGVAVTVDLAGNQIVANGDTNALVVEGEMTLINSSSDEAQITVNATTPLILAPTVAVEGNGVLNIEDGKIEITGSKNSAGISAEGGTININGGTIHVAGTGATYGLFVHNGATINMNGGEIIVDAPEAKEAYGIQTMFGSVDVNLNAGKISVLSPGTYHYAVAAVAGGRINLTIAEDFVFDVVEGASEYNSDVNVVVDNRN